MFHLSGRLLLLLAVVVLASSIASAQSATYHLHGEASSTAGRLQLKTAGPDVASQALQSANLKNAAAGEYVVKEFDSQAGDPNASGTIPAGSNISVTVWMKKTATAGTMFPRAKVYLNGPSGSFLCTLTGSTALTTTLTQYTLTGTTGGAVTMAAADRFYVWVGINMTTGPGPTIVKAELDVEGTLNGNYDSQATLPLPAPPPPVISSLSPTSGLVGTGVTIAGSDFGATQGASTVTFNGTAATPSSWSATSIVAPVPNGATTGPVVVTVVGVASNGATFTVNTPTTATIAGTVTKISDATAIAGALVEALQSGSVLGSATTAANGGYSISGLAPGTYDLRASADGYRTGRVYGLAAPAGTTTADFTLAAESSAISYVYDDLGRLVAVVDPTGETAVYSYDAAGNLLSIERRSSTVTSIVSFTPSNGPGGQTVTIYGTGFSATPSQNTVAFNGSPATVTSSTATQIVTTVPAAAVTGPISVTTPAGSATSSTPFTVSAAPAITGFMPAIVSPGATVTIDGANFDPLAAHDVVTFNITQGSTVTATGTSITATSPSTTPAAGYSGRITVATPDGTAASATDLFVVPPPFAPSDVAATGRMSVGGSGTFTIGTANKIGLVLFDATAGRRASLKVNSTTIGGGTISIYAPRGALLGTANLSSNGYFESQALPLTGTYTILIDPSGSYSGNINMTLYDVVDIAGTVTVDGPPVTAPIATPGQVARYTFSGTAGQAIGVQHSTGTPLSGFISILDPSGAVVASTGFSTLGSFFETALPVTGTYTLKIDPSLAGTGNITATLTTIPPDATGTIAIGGPSVNLTTTAPGQNGRLDFVGTTGRRVSLRTTSATITSIGLAIYKPDGTQLATASSNGYVDATTLPVDGTYSILLDPASAQTGTMTSTLYDVVDVDGGTIAIGGPSVTVTTTAPGQIAFVTFAGTAGARVSLRGSGSITQYGLSILEPGGGVLASGNDFVDATTLPVTGTYRINVNPADYLTGSVTLTLYNVVDVAGSITANGSTLSVALTTPGQNSRHTFGGTVGQRVSLKAKNVTALYKAYVNLVNPSGSAIGSIYLDASQNVYEGFIDTTTLSTNGTYAVVVDPESYFTGTAELTLYTVPADVTGTLTVNGSSVNVTTTTPGQNANLTFSGTSGQPVTVKLTRNTMGAVTVSLLNPSGSTVTSTTSSVRDFNLSTVTLSATGTYTVRINPSGTNTGGITVKVTSP